MTKALDPLAMLLDAARFIEDEKPDWAKAAREAVGHARAQPPTAREPTDEMIEAGARGIVEDVANHDGGPSFDEMHEQSRKEARDVAKACLYAALSVPPGDQAPQTLGGMIAAIYGELDAEDCNKIDRAWIEWRGRGTITYALASEVKKP